MRRSIAAVVITLLALTVTAGAQAAARPAAADEKSGNITRLAQVPIMMGKDLKADGSDMAFSGNLAVAGTYEGIALFRILPQAPYLKELSFYQCPAAQDDVSILGHYVIASIDSPSSNSVHNAVCNNTDDSTGKEGIRIIDISNPKQPTQVKFVETDCGSHTHTVVPDGAKTYVYIESYPLGAPTSNCNPESHRKISVVEFPTSDPTKAKVVGTPDVSPEIGCHDITIFPARHLAGAACIGETDIWDIKDPAHPKVLSRIYNPAIMIHHGTGFTWDGKYMAIGDEFAGSITGECAGNQKSPSGALWFYDITDPTSPSLAGYYNVPRTQAPHDTSESYIACTTHVFGVVPTRDPKSYIATVAYRSSGLSVVDFSDPANPKEIGYYMQTDKLPDLWCAYWYNGRIYTNDLNSKLGVTVYELKGLDRQHVHYYKGDMNPQVQIANFAD
ncbi:MAG: hypothetical protein M3290_13705 [Actinomycetota bacterium]|nr:hypothetical protein [Actinomycetota bacterium]